MGTYGLGVLPSLFGGSPSPFLSNAGLDSPLRSPTPRALSPSPTVLDQGDDDDDDRRQNHYHDRRASSSSSDDDSASTRKLRTSPDFSSLTPHSAAPNSPQRAPGLPSLGPSSSARSPYPHHPSSSSATSSLASTPSSAVNAVPHDDDDDDECEDGGELPILPMRVPRPKTKADRDRERALGLVPNPGAKREGLGVKLARKRANSLKWAKYANQGAFEVELGLSNDDLKRE
ncbi:hypothetical protein JCM3775_007187 [Rhodotorula graminis]|uniref:Uncharacterized protein n=1 Tax=Rhodotorula graminis (strain WP1) TaxID=578459 RepID=A0A0P9EMD3_RHOGW|nr:uncharacterized protein RHOBADRAFT_46520 [Rhodotorula graminis WP1]KPV72930.1 hypothetical protein RHOBADRAFT_46520 [Rhodotorula graminis WP1]